MAVAPRYIGLVGLLALVPVVAYALGKPDPVHAGVAALNVVLITASLWIATRTTATNRHAH